MKFAIIVYVFVILSLKFWRILGLLSQFQDIKQITSNIINFFIKTSLSLISYGKCPVKTKYLHLLRDSKYKNESHYWRDKDKIFWSSPFRLNSQCYYRIQDI